MQLVSYGAQDI
jgi:hypothetical protein